MPVKTVIDVDQNLVLHLITDSFRMTDIEPAWKAMLADPQFRPEMNVLWDFRKGTHALEFSTDDIQNIVSMTANHIKQRGASYRLALLATKDLFFGLSKMFAAYGDEIPIDIHVFRSMDEALDWLHADSSVKQSSQS